MLREIEVEHCKWEHVQADEQAKCVLEHPHLEDGAGGVGWEARSAVLWGDPVLLILRMGGVAKHFESSAKSTQKTWIFLLQGPECHVGKKQDDRMLEERDQDEGDGTFSPTEWSNGACQARASNPRIGFSWQVEVRSGTDICK